MRGSTKARVAQENRAHYVLCSPLSGRQVAQLGTIFRDATLPISDVWGFVALFWFAFDYVGSSICSRFCSSVGTRSDVPIFVDSSSLLFRDRDSTTDDVVFLFPSRVLLCYHRLDF